MTTTAAAKRPAAKTAAAKKTTAAAKTPAKPKDPWAGWPTKGGNDQPQPWDLEALGLDQKARELGPKPNTVAPVVVRAGLPILTEGSADARVGDLCRRLAFLGYESSVSAGENHHDVVDKTVIQAVSKFRTDYGLEEPPSDTFGGATREGQRVADAHIGPYTWEAVIRASDRDGYQG